MKRAAIGMILLATLSGTVSAHHGVASLGVAGLEGPGAPLETSSSATLPPGDYLIYTKLDYARFKTFSSERTDESTFSAFWIYGLGYGVKSWLSAYLFVPFSTKAVKDNSFNTSGFTDLALTAVVGFKLDQGLRLVPENESLDDLADWHFTVYGGLTLPTGDANIQDAAGAIDPGSSLGFGRPAYQLGGTATRQFTDRFTAVGDFSWITFSEYEYADGTRFRFGDEVRANAAGVFRLVTREEGHLRLDANLEANYLRLGRDEAFGVGEEATGGQMIYVVPGARLYFKNMSLAGGVKLPAWTDLNEEDEQQGAEGTEDYRAIVTFSALF